LLARFELLHAALTCYRRFLSYKICLWTKISSVATLKPHRDRGSVGSEYFDARLALASRHLRVKDFPSRGSKKMTWQRDCESFSNFKCCVILKVLEPQSAGQIPHTMRGASVITTAFMKRVGKVLKLPKCATYLQSNTTAQISCICTKGSCTFLRG
jgi:hypothetical protein